MREAQKAKTVEIQEQNGGVSSRPPSHQGKPGVWPGHANPGRFKVGADPRRNLTSGPWANHSRISLEEALKVHTQDAVNFLESTLNNESLPIQARMEAAKEILNRSHGTPVSRSVVATLSEERPVATMTRDELLAAMSAQYSISPTQVIEHEPENVEESES